MNHKDCISAELKEHEKLIWSGRPKTGWAFGRHDIFLIPMTGLWFIMGMLGVVSLFILNLEKIEAFFPLIGELFPIFVVINLFFGAFVSFGRFILAAHIRSKTTYGLTNQRILINSTFFRKRVQSVDFESVKELLLLSEKEAYGSVYFGGDIERHLLGTISTITGLAMRSFERIENPEWVHDKLKSLLNQPEQRSQS